MLGDASIKSMLLTLTFNPDNFDLSFFVLNIFGALKWVVVEFKG
jgi:hypothetical protein